MTLSSFLLISPAFADAGAVSSFDPMQFLPLVVIFAIFYFLFLRPQQKRQKQKAEMIKALRRGDKVITSSGFFASVDRIVNDQEVMLELASGVVVRAVKDTIVDVVTKPHPMSEPTSSNVVELDKTPPASAAKPSKPAAKKAPVKPSKPKK